MGPAELSSSGLAALLDPRGIAIVGASDRAGTWPTIIKQNLERFGYPHPVYAVNPRYETLWGEPCYPNLTALPETPSLAICIVPADVALEVVEEGGRLGVGAANIFSAGFGEGGDPDGLVRAERLRAIAQETGIRICGPNCMGNIAARARAATVANAYMRTLEPGPVALVGQSGGLLMAVHRSFEDRAVDVGYLVMSGGEVDLSLADYISYLADDPDTRVICLFVEGIQDADAFLAACDKARQRGKPIVAVKVGASERGRKAALAHTGVLAGATAVFEAVAQDHGVISVPAFDEMIETTELLLHATPPPQGSRLGVICASGGLKTLMIDLAEREGVDLPELAPETLDGISEQVGLGASVGNPLDHGAGGVAAHENYLRCVQLMMDDEHVDMLLLQGELPRSPATKNRAFEPLNELASTLAKPFAYFSLAAHSVTEHGRDFRRQVPNFALLQGANRALRAARRVAEYYRRARRVGNPAETASPHPSLAQRAGPSPLPEGEARGHSSAIDLSELPSGLLDEASAGRLLRTHGLILPRSAFAATAEAAVAEAHSIGFPVALKVVADGVTHKTEVGGVRLNIGDDAGVARAFAEIQTALNDHRPDSVFRGVLVTEMVTPGLEVILGFQRDADMGPVVMLGTGGILVELVKRVSFRQVPVPPDQAEALVAEVGLTPLLDGWRGGERLDRAALREAIVAFGQLAADLGPALETMEVNPLVVLGEGDGVRVLDALVALSPRP